MKYIANIITSKNNEEHPFRCSFINYIHSMDEMQPNIPTLIIGWEFANEIVNKNIFNLNILDKNPSEHIYWTFAKREKRIEYEQDLLSFIGVILKYIKQHNEYTYYNILASSYTKNKQLIKFIRSKSYIKYFYIDNDRMIYVFFNNRIIGTSFDDLSYIGITKNKILHIIKGCNNNLLLNDFKCDNFIKNLTKDDKYLLPYIYFLSQN